MDEEMRAASNAPSRRDRRRGAASPEQKAAGEQQARMRARTPDAYDLAGNVDAPDGTTSPYFQGDDEPSAEVARQRFEEYERSRSNGPTRKQRQRSGP